MMILLERTSSLGAGDRPILSPLQRPIAHPNVVLVSPGWFLPAGFLLSVADCEP
jgi:hypothetical protein